MSGIVFLYVTAPNSENAARIARALVEEKLAACVNIHAEMRSVYEWDGKVEIVVISRHQEPNDLGCLKSLGIDPAAKRYLMLKSRIHYRAGFRDVAKAVIECAGVGVCTSDYGQLTFQNVRRPIFPLDPIGDADGA